MPYCVAFADLGRLQNMVDVMRYRVIISDKTKRLNLFNYEQRLVKMRTVLALMLGELDEAIESYRQEKSSDGKPIIPNV
jgi:hypothetical protein